MHLGRLIVIAKSDKKEKRLKKQEVRDLEVHFFSYKKMTNAWSRPNIVLIISSQNRPTAAV